MAGGDKDEVGRDLLKTFSQHPATVLSMIIAGLAVAWLSFGAYNSIRTEIRDIGNDIDRVKSAQTTMSNRVDKIEEKTTEKLDMMQRDLSDVKATVKGLDTGVNGLNRNLEILIRQNQPPPPR